MDGTKVGELNINSVTVAEFCRGLGFSDATFYRLKGEQRPRQVKIGGRLRVLETPQEYFARQIALQSGDKAAA